MTRIAGKERIHYSNKAIMKFAILLIAFVLASTVLYQFKNIKDERDYFREEALRLNNALSKRNSDLKALFKTNQRLMANIEIMSNDSNSSCTLKKALTKTWKKYTQITVDFWGKVSNKIASLGSTDRSKE